MSNIRTIKLKEGHIIPLKFDFEFSGIFNNTDNIIIVENFVALYLNEPISKIRGNVTIKSRYLPINNKANKDKQIDLLVDLDGEKINIELNNRQSLGIIDRNVVYACEVHGKQLKYKDNDYSGISRTIQINLNNFKCNKNGKLVDTYYLRNEDGKILTEKFRIDYVDLVNAKENRYNEHEEKLARFCRAINAETMADFKKEIGGIMEKEAEDKLTEEVEKYSRDDEVIALYSAYSREELERNTLLKEGKEEARKEGLAEGRAEGRKEGRKEGKKEANLEIAKNLLDINMSIDNISKVTGLSKEEILALKND